MSASSPTKTRTFRIPEHLWAAAKERSQIEGVTITDVVIQALRDFVYGDTPED